MKKELNQQNRQHLQAKKNNKRWLWSIPLLALLAAGLLPIYQQRQLSAPERWLNQGARLEAEGEFVAAQQLYQQLYADYPQAEQAPQALLRSGRIWRLDRQHDQQALLSYLQLEHGYPRSPLVLTAQQEAAKLVKYSLRDFSRAIEYYQRLLDADPSAGDDYLYQIADCYYRLDNYNQARIELDSLLQGYPQSALRATALYRKGGLHLLEKQLEQAQQSWQQLVDQHPQSEYAVQARFNLAKLLEEQSRLSEALQQYQQLSDFPQQQLLEDKIERLKKRIAAKKEAI